MNSLFWHRGRDFLVRATRPCREKIVVRGIRKGKPLEVPTTVFEGWHIATDGQTFMAIRRTFLHHYNWDYEDDRLTRAADEACRKLVEYFEGISE